MHFVIERAGNRMIPGELFGQSRQFIGVTLLEQGAHTWLSQGQVPDCLQQVEQNHDGHSVEDERFERVHHLEQRD